MGSCTRRHFLLSICFLQMITIIERQVFDFLGYMWAPILANFFHIIFVIFGFYGAYHFRIKYIITYLIWNFIWIGWNSFLICFYLDVGILDKDSDILNLGTGSVSWFEVNGYGCKPSYPINITSEDPYRPVRPDHVDDCLLDYPIVEIIHSGIQCILAIFAIIGAILIAYIFLDEDDHLRKGSKKSSKKQRKSLYSIEFGPPVDTIRGRPDILDYGDDVEDRTGQLSPKPMTPRRVKRRSVMTRGTHSRQSTTSRRSHTSSRSSVRNSRRKYHPHHPHHPQNPITKIMDQQQSIKPFASFIHTDNPNLTATNLKTLNHDIIAAASTSNSGGNKIDNYTNFAKSVSPDPIYYNTSGSTVQLQQSWNTSNSPTHQIVSVGGHSSGGAGSGGHYNPSYQHSTPNLSNSNEHVDEMYNNRPPSVRSSYSNFHGTRPISSYNPTTENVFAEIPGGSGGRGGGSSSNQVHHANIPPPSSSSPVQPQVPSRIRTSSRESIRSMAFLNSGPPAYNLNYHTPPDSETTM